MGGRQPHNATERGDCAAFLALMVIIVVVVYRAGGDQLADETNVEILLQQPGAALAHAAILQYRPVNTDVTAHLRALPSVVRALALARADSSQCHISCFRGPL